jgi:hypothetical protein
VYSLSITFITPIDTLAYVNENYVLINVSISDDQDTYAFIDWQDSLVGWFRMDNDSSVGENNTYAYDWSGKGNASLSGAGDAFPNATGKFNSSFQFLGNGAYLESVRNTYSGPITISLWAKSSSTQNNVGVFSLTHQGASNTEFQIKIQGGEYRVDYGTNNQFSLTALTSDWTHVVIVHNTTHFIPYVNGQAQSSIAYGTTQGHDNLILGANWDATTFFNGFLDEVVVFTRSLSSQEILALYNSSQYYLSNNFTELSDGNYPYTINTVDADGNLESDSREAVVGEIILR